MTSGGGTGVGAGGRQRKGQVRERRNKRESS
jgi:hypothetical protein